VVPESNMPGFPWLFDATLEGSKTGVKMEALRKVGVPYTDDDIAGARDAVADKKEIDALIAYLQQLGTLLQVRR
jgi:cytochrome c oxidase cbb3-type subunit 2